MLKNKVVYSSLQQLKNEVNVKNKLVCNNNSVQIRYNDLKLAIDLLKLVFIAKVTFLVIFDLIHLAQISYTTKNLKKSTVIYTIFLFENQKISWLPVQNSKNGCCYDISNEIFINRVESIALSEKKSDYCEFK